METLPATSAPDRGHPPVIFRDRARARKILKTRKDGGTKVMCAQAGNVGRRTLYAWLERAEAIRDTRMEEPLAQCTPYDKDYLWFLHEWENADFAHKLKHVQNLENAADEGSIAASKYLLEKMHPDEFGNQPTITEGSRDEKQIIMLNIPAIPSREPILAIPAEVIEIEDD